MTSATMVTSASATASSSTAVTSTPTESSSTESSSPTSSPAGTVLSGAIIGAADDADKNGSGNSRGQAIAGITAEPFTGFDRITITFSGTGMPSYHVGYQDTPAQQGTNTPILTGGDAFLVAYFANIASAEEAGIADPELGQFTAGQPHVSQILSGSTVDGLGQVIVGVTGGKLPYAVGTLENPPRLVIDVAV
ncbi:MAG: hypothetical protein SPI77_07390 [Corynebacterium sp.]|nr:hypothetical protein [Corynebacterium sp.]